MGKDKRAVWENYVAAWKAEGAEAKRELLKVSNDEANVYRDPLVEAQGHEKLVEYMVAFHQQVPGGHFVTTYFLDHHERSIARWNMVDGEGKVIGDGISYAEYNSAGLLTGETGFFETPAS